jgi:hypothetical protein
MTLICAGFEQRSEAMKQSVAQVGLFRAPDQSINQFFARQPLVGQRDSKAF